MERKLDGYDLLAKSSDGLSLARSDASSAEYFLSLRVIFYCSGLAIIGAFLDTYLSNMGIYGTDEFVGELCYVFATDQFPILTN